MTKAAARNWAEININGYPTTAELAIALVEMDPVAIRLDCENYNYNASTEAAATDGDLLPLDVDGWTKGLELAMKERLRGAENEEVLAVVNAVARATGYEELRIVLDSEDQLHIIDVSSESYYTRSTDDIGPFLRWRLEELQRAARCNAAMPESRSCLKSFYD